MARFVTAAACLLSQVLAAKHANQVVLNDENFDKLVQNEQTIFVKFYAEWCGHCEALAPLWDEMAGQMLGEDILFGEYNAGDHKEKKDEYKVGGMPTLLMFHNGIPKEFKGKRETTAQLVEYAKSHAGIGPKALHSQQEIDAVLSGDEPAIITFINQRGTREEKVAMAVCEWKRDTHTAYRVMNPDLVWANWGGADLAQGYTESSKKRAAALALYRPLQSNKMLWYDKDLTDGAELDRWINENQYSLVDWMDQRNQDQYRYNKKKPMVVAFIGDELEFDDVKGELLKVSKDLNNEFFFLATRSTEWNEYLIQEFSSILPDTGTNLAVWQYTHKNIYFSPSDDITESNIRKTIKDFKAGKLVRLVKSEALPEANPVDGLTTIVAYNAEEILDRKDDKAIFVMLHADWCGHCKAAMPLFEKLAKALENVDEVIVAAFEQTKNTGRVDYIPRGFPTFFFSTPETRKEGQNIHVRKVGRTPHHWVEYLKEQLPHVAFPDVPPEEEETPLATEDQEALDYGQKTAPPAEEGEDATPAAEHDEL